MNGPSTQQQYLHLAFEATSKATELAQEAEKYARHADYPHKVAPLATLGALWADIARAHAAIAQALPEPLPELPTTQEW